jgi:glutamate--cysteine ligase
MRFLEAMLLYCLLHESPPIEDDEYAELGINQGRVAERGRQPGLELIRGGENIALQAWASELLEGISSVCKLLDQGFDKPLYMPALEAQRARVQDPDMTPSARVLREMLEQGESFLQFGSRWARQHRDYFHGLQRCDPGRVSQFVSEASASVARQRDIERKDNLSFKQYLEKYFSA